MHDLSVLQHMPNCSYLTQREVSLYGGISSLLYLSKNYNAMESPPRKQFFYYLKVNDGFVAKLIIAPVVHADRFAARVENRYFVSYLRTTTAECPRFLNPFASHFKRDDEEIS